MSYKSILSLITVLLLTPTLAAQESCPERPARSAKAKQLAGKWFAEGERLSKESRFEDALDAFLCSNKMLGHENTVFNIAHISKQMEDKPATLARLRDYREENPDVAFATEIDKVIAELEEELGEDHEVETVDESLFAEEEEAEPEPADDGEPLTGRQRAGVGLLSGAGVTLVMAFAFQGAAGANKNKAEDATSWSTFQDKRDKMKGFQTAALTCYIATGVLAGIGLYLVLGDEEDAGAADGSVEVSLAPAPTGLVLKGAF